MHSKERDEAIFIFGHELGHILNRDFTTNFTLLRLTKETNADRFGGCVAGALGVSWDHLQGLLSRIRGDIDEYYPILEHSLEAAREGFNRCGRIEIKSDEIKKPTVSAELDRATGNDDLKLDEGLANPKQDSIGYRFCNNTLSYVSIITAGRELDDPNNYSVRGWTNLRPGVCAEVIKYTRNSNFFYFAQGRDGGYWDGPVAFCIGTAESVNTGFVIKGSLSELEQAQCDPGRVRGFKSLRVDRNAKEQSINLVRTP